MASFVDETGAAGAAEAPFSVIFGFEAAGAAPLPDAGLSRSVGLSSSLSPVAAGVSSGSAFLSTSGFFRPPDSVRMRRPRRTGWS